MGSREFARGRRVVARLPHGGDLLEEIAAVADAHGMQAAELRAIGALQTARLAFYDQATHDVRRVRRRRARRAGRPARQRLAPRRRHRRARHATLAGTRRRLHRRPRGARLRHLRLRAHPAGARRRIPRARATTRSPACRSGAACERGATAARRRGPARHGLRRGRKRWCRKGDLNPHEVIPSLGPQPSASTNSAIPTLRECEYRTRAGKVQRGRRRSGSLPRFMTMGGPCCAARPSAAPPSTASKSPRPWSAETVAPTGASPRV